MRQHRDLDRDLNQQAHPGTQATSLVRLGRTGPQREHMTRGRGRGGVNKFQDVRRSTGPGR